jgi:hypothetical protein
VNVPAVTIASVQRAIKAAEGLGKPVAGVRLRPDRSVEILFGEPAPVGLLTPQAAAPPSADLDAELSEWSARHGYG